VKENYINVRKACKKTGRKEGKDKEEEEKEMFEGEERGG
jgi:hypothetical protein